MTDATEYARKRDQERTFFNELKTMVDQMGADWIIESIATAEEELRDAQDENTDAEVRRNDDRMRAEDFRQ